MGGNSPAPGPEWVSTLVWLGFGLVFAALEIPAVVHRVPWLPLSDWTWSWESFAGWVPYVVLFALAALLVHLVARQY